MNGALQNKTILIAGGTTGLGLSAARACAAAGANIVVAGRNPDSAQQALAALGASTGRDAGAAARAVVGDLSDPAIANAAVEKAVAEFGALHGLYHVAGGSGRKMGDGPLHEISDEGWEQTLRLNLSSLFYTNRAAVRQFLKQGGGGAILNMSSVLAFSPSPQFFATHAYATAKAAIIGFSTSTAAYYAPQNIRVNVVAPALVDTPMARRAAGDEAIRKFIAAKQPLDGGRIGQPADLDAAVVYFLSDAAKFVTGQVLAIDGGWSVTDGGLGFRV
jgi:NAD(P)-dependent dehydrogenase (short-subunit alcohol dehydrogenase family)